MRIGICGHGTVGGGTFNLLRSKASEIKRRVGMDLEVVHVATRRPSAELKASGVHYSTDVFEVARNPEVDLVVELIGGFEPALELVLYAIENGKHVVTANKALIAVHGNTIFEAARKKGVVVAYESAVAGGIPIIKALREGLAANSIQWLAGIINGTSNFILTEMGERKRDFPEVLKEAQELGYAEADPTFDVEGIDAAHKLTILAANAFGIALEFDRVYTEGISHITTADISYAEELGYRIKHLGITRVTDAGVELRVHPTLISENTLIANVHGVMNAVVVKGDSAGSTLYYGAGAGAEATASSVVADIIDIARTWRESRTQATIPPLAFNKLRNDLRILDISEIESEYYLRIPARDKVGVMAKISQVLTNYGINIEAVIQKEPHGDDAERGIVPVVILTSRTSENTMDVAIGVIEGLDEVGGSIMRIRVEQFDGEDN
ncbi:homoserine dehydrogenase [Pseudohongiella spirulinae]|uniref:homoserine dehydrogenase n=1 Tax=Pseudohongiella spirulinae TaxID=1249552 RepID=UPI0012E34A68